MLRDFLASFATLRVCPRELWLAFFIKFCESYAYFAMSLNFTIYLTDEHGFSDVTAGVLYGVWGFLISVFGLASGALLIDTVGVRRSLLLAGAFSGAGRLMFALAPAYSSFFIYASVLLLMPIGISITLPATMILIKRTTIDSNRSVAYGLFYAIMNVAALAAGPSTDLIVWYWPNESKSSAHLRFLFIITAAISLLYLVVAFFLRSDAAIAAVRRGAQRQLTEDNDDDDVDLIGDDDVNEPATTTTTAAAAAKPAACGGACVQSIKHAIADPVFRRLAVFMALISLCRLIFRHLDATWPKCIVRVAPDTPYGSIYAINPFMIILLVPLTQAALRRFVAFNCIVVGSVVASASVLFMALDFGVVTSILFVVTLSIGEAIYSPRVYEYTMALSPKGREGFYSTLASTPMYLAKLIAGSVSGVLLERFCAAEPPPARAPEVMWLIIGLTSLVPCLAMGALKWWLYDDVVKRREAAENN